MAITDQTPVNSYTASGSTTVFPYTFKITVESDLQVTLNGYITTTGFTISGVGEATGGNVTFTTAPSAGVVVRLTRVIPYDRTTDYQTNGDLLADTLNADIDRVVMQVQQLKSVSSGSPEWPLIGHRPFVETMIDITEDCMASDLGYTAIKILSGGGFTVASGKTLTIDVPFEAGLYQVFSGSGTVVFGSGSVTEVYPEWWGAVADGSTDCSSALNAAVIAVAGVGGGVLRLSAGVYRGYIDVYEKHNIQIVGAGREATTLKPADNEHNLIGTLQSAVWPDNFTYNLTVRDLTLDGDYDTIPANTLGPGGTFDDDLQLGIYFMRVNGYLVENVHFTNIWVTNDFFWTNLSEDIVGKSDTMGIIRNCKFSNIGDKAITLPGGSAFNAHLEIDDYTRNVIVEDCVFVGTDPAGTVVKPLVNCNMGGEDVFAENVVFRNNYFQNQAVGIYAYGVLYDWKVTGNTFVDVVECVYLWGQNSLPNDLYPRSCIIDGNTVRNTINGASGKACLRVYGLNPTFANNKLLLGNYGLGVAYTRPVDGSSNAIHSTALITGNTIQIGKLLDDSGGAIFVMGGGVVSGNNIECSDNTGPGEAIFVYVDGMNASDSVVITDNIILGVTTAHSADPDAYSARVTRSNNKYSAGALCGNATLSSGLVTVSTTEIRSGDTVRTSRVVRGAAPGQLTVDRDSITAGVSFVIDSTSATDNGTIFWEIIH